MEWLKTLISVLFGILGNERGSVDVDVAMVKMYSANVFHLSQQKESRFRNYVRNETQKGEEDFYDRIGTVEAQLKSGRHSDTTYQDTPHTRRRVTMDTYFYADLVDKEDKLKIIQNPESEYAQAASMALGRQIDDTVIAGMLGTAYEGKAGGTATAFTNAQRLAAHDGSTLTQIGLNVRTLRAVKKKFNQNETGDSQLYIAVTAEQLDSLLGETEITSSDYNVVRTLVHGDIDTFMGFYFLRSERLTRPATNYSFNVNTGAVGSGTGTATATACKYCLAWQKEGVILSIGADVTARIDELPQKHYTKQVYASLSLGSVRLEDAKVIAIICAES